MKSKISQILADIRSKQEELKQEYLELMSNYWFSFNLWKIVFNKDKKIENKKYKKKILDTIFSTQIREILAIPFIYSMFVPTLILDFFLLIYQNVAFRLYNIPFVKRNEYITYDRKELDYLNIIQKTNCLYCSYVNWLFSYAVEIAWRTERYWCPIKSAKKMKWWHDWQEYFADYWSPEWFKEAFFDIESKVECFQKK